MSRDLQPFRSTATGLNTRRKLIAALVVLSFMSYVVYRGANRGSDFKYPYGAARLLWTTGKLHVQAQPRYPLSLHVLLSPLAGLPFWAAVSVWAAISFASMAALPGVLARLSDIDPRRQFLAWVLVAPFFADALILGQSDPINIFLVAAGLLAAKQGRAGAGAMLVGLAGMIKILPSVHWLTIFARTRSWRVWPGIVLTILLGLGLIVAAAGWEPALLALREQAQWLRDQEKPWHLVARGGDLRPNNESLPIVLARTFGDLPTNRRDPNATSLARLPLPLIWSAWFTILGAMAVAWLASVRPAERLDDGRGWLALFALTSIIMLAATPICWNHYFLWTFPAALFLNHRPKLLVAAAILSLIGSASQTARALGCHMALALGLFLLVAVDLRREARSRSVSPATEPP